MTRYGSDQIFFTRQRNNQSLEWSSEYKYKSNLNVDQINFRGGA
jgi:hypothetical protein